MNTENNEKNKLQSGTKALIWILLILIAVILSLLFYNIYSNSREQEMEDDPSMGLNEKKVLVEVGNKKRPDETVNLDDVHVSLKDQLVFNLDDLDFKFVVAKVHVQSDNSEPVNISLSHFKTSEGIALDDVNSYVKQLEEKSYFLGRQNVWFSLVSDQPSFDANIFIPVKDKNAKSIQVESDFGDKKKIDIPLTDVNGKKEMLKYNADDVITDGDSYEMKVSQALDISGSYLYKNVAGEETEYLLPSTTKVYAFKIDVVSLFGDVTQIDDASYVPTNSKETFKALEKGINSMKYQNILGRQIKEKDSGWLFFVAFNPDQNPITYNGALKLKVKGQDNWITINVNLN